MRHSWTDPPLHDGDSISGPVNLQETGQCAKSDINDLI